MATENQFSTIDQPCHADVLLAIANDTPFRQWSHGA